MPVMSDKAGFVKTVLHCVQRYRGNRYFTAPKLAPSGKELIFIPTNKWADNMLMLHVDVNMK